MTEREEIRERLAVHAFQATLAPFNVIATHNANNYDVVIHRRPVNVTFDAWCGRNQVTWRLMDEWKRWDALILFEGECSLGEWPSKAANLSFTDVQVAERKKALEFEAWSCFNWAILREEAERRAIGHAAWMHHVDVTFTLPERADQLSEIHKFHFPSLADPAWNRQGRLDFIRRDQACKAFKVFGEAMSEWTVALLAAEEQVASLEAKLAIARKRLARLA